MSHSIRDRLRAFVLERFLSGEDPAFLRDDSPLISSGIITSLSLVKLVVFIGKEFGVELQAHEMSAEYLDTIAAMEKLITDRQAK